jgi:WXXGXW repeat (2 copies)
MRACAVLIGLIITGSTLSGCVVSPRGVKVRAPVVTVSEVMVTRAPPPLRVEPVPPPPSGPTKVWVWQPGHWYWDGRDYDWKPGHYEKRPARAASWVAPTWVARGSQWVFVPGHWAYR